LFIFFSLSFSAYFRFQRRGRRHFSLSPAAITPRRHDADAAADIDIDFAIDARLYYITLIRFSLPLAITPLRHIFSFH